MTAVGSPHSAQMTPLPKTRCLPIRRQNLHTGFGLSDFALAHVDTEQAHEQLINSRLAYVSVSRGRYDAQIYTNNVEELVEELRRNVSKQTALETEHVMGASDQAHTIETAERQSVSGAHVDETTFEVRSTFDTESRAFIV